MMRNMEYLSDTELENMIREIEQNDLVPAPPDLQLAIVEKLERMDKLENMEKPEPGKLEKCRAQDKVIAFKKYRFRVLTTVAAAVFVVLVLPKLESLQLPEIEFSKPMPGQESVLQSRYGSKEEALYGSSKLEKLFGGVNIFADNDRYRLFRE